MCEVRGVRCEVGRGSESFLMVLDMHAHLAVLTFDFAVLNISKTVVPLACRGDI